MLDIDWWRVAQALRFGIKVHLQALRRGGALLVGHASPLVLHRTRHLSHTPTGAHACMRADEL